MTEPGRGLGRLRLLRAAARGGSREPAQVPGRGRRGRRDPRPRSVRRGRAEREAPPHRRAPSSRAAALDRRRGGRPQDRPAAARRLDAAALDRGHGPGRGRDLDRVDQRAERVVRRRRRGAARSRASATSMRAKLVADHPGRFGHVRHPAAARRRGQPARDRIRVRHAEGRRRLPDDQLPEQVSRRPGVRAGDGRAQPPQGGGVHPSGARRTAAATSCRTSPSR